MNPTMKITVAIVATAIVIGAGTYYVVNNRASSDKAELQNTVDNLNAQLESTAATNSTVNTNISNTNVAAGATNTSTNTNSQTNTNSVASTAACKSSNLTASLTNGQGTAGTYYYTLNLKNTGSTSCIYKGSSAVSLLDKNNVSLGSMKEGFTSNVTIGANKSVYAAVSFPDYSNFTQGVCTSGATTLALYPPDQSVAVMVTGIETLQPGWTNYYCPGFAVQSFSTVKP